MIDSVELHLHWRAGIENAICFRAAFFELNVRVVAELCANRMVLVRYIVAETGSRTFVIHLSTTNALAQSDNSFPQMTVFNIVDVIYIKCIQ